MATAVLYAHPHISEGNLDRFISNVQESCAYMASDNKISLVHHLTVRPTAMRPKDDKMQSRHVDSSLPSLTRLFPVIHSFVLRDCLIDDRHDAITVFSSLLLMKPQKARLEVRMWALYDTEVGRDLALAIKSSAYGFTGAATSLAGSTASSSSLQGNWRDAIYGDRDLTLPRDWLDPDERERAMEEVRVQGQHGFLPAINVAAPHDVVDTHNPGGARLQIPVAGLHPLTRAIELCRDVFRTDFARSSVPDDQSIRRELIRAGPFLPQMTRQHASTVLQRLGHRLAANGSHMRDQEIVKRANAWADAARVRVIQEASRSRRLVRRQLVRGALAQDARTERSNEIRSELQSARLGRSRTSSFVAGLGTAPAYDHDLSDTWFVDTFSEDLTDPLRPDNSSGTRSNPIFVSDSDDSDDDAAGNILLQEA